MPIYKVKPETDHGCAMPAPSKPRKKRYPTVTIPVSKEIVDALAVDGQVEVTLKGTVRGLETRQSSDTDSWSNRTELRVELRTVEAYAGEEADDEEDEKEPDMKDAIDKGLGYRK
jgi:hypothetical protein